MSISIYNYNKSSQEFTNLQQVASTKLSTLNKFQLIKNSKPLKVIEYVIKKKSTVHNSSSSFKIKSVTKIKRQKSRLRPNKLISNEAMLKTMHQRHNNQHFQQNHHHQHHQQQQQYSQYQPNQFNFNNNNNNNQMSHGQVQFTGLTPNTFQGQQQQHRRVFKPLNKSKSIKIARGSNNNGNIFQNQNKQFSFQPTTNSSVPVSTNLSSNANFTNIMSASFGVNPGVAAAAAAACATLAQLLRSELTINLAKDQPRLVISGPSNRQCQAMPQQSNYLNYNNNNTSNSQAQFLNQKSKLPVGQAPQGHRFKYFKSGNFNNSLATSAAAVASSAVVSTSLPSTSVAAERKQSMPLAINIGGKNKTAPYNTTQYIMHDYCKRRSFKDQVCPSDDFSDDWNNALKEATSTVDSTTSSSNFFNFNFLNVNKSKLGDGLESGPVAAAAAPTNDESNLVEIGKKLSRSVSYLSTNSNNIESIDMKDESENDYHKNDQDLLIGAQLSSSL
jgi:hypothetical protein